MRLYEEIRPIAKEKYDTIALKLRELLLKFQPDTMTEREKLMFSSDISKIILAYVFCYRDNDVSYLLEVCNNRANLLWT